MGVVQNIEILSAAGGLFFLLTFVHFFVDWLFQSHKEAMLKTISSLVRTRHCLIYSAGFIPILLLMKFDLWEFCAALFILFFSHFLEDTYIPVYLWTKYVRKPPEMFGLNNSKEGFIKFAKTSLGRVIVITVDQIIHITFLIPLVWMALN